MTSISGCYKCETQTYKSHPHLICRQCLPGMYLFSNQNGSFTACVADCQSISTGVVNDVVAQVCQSCGDACQECHPVLGCVTCPGPGYVNKVINQQFNVCTRCSDILNFTNGYPCATCSTTTQCDSTYPSLAPLLPGSTYDAQSSTCMISKSGICERCRPPLASGGPYGSETACSKSCPIWCEECISLCEGGADNCVYCKSCAYGYYSSGVSKFVKSGVQYSGVLSCNPCQNMSQNLVQTCGVCSSEGQCTQCKFPYVKDASGGCSQMRCVSGYYAKVIASSVNQYIECTQCGSGCRECTSPTSCTSCKETYYLSGKQCIAKQQGSFKLEVILSAINITELQNEDGTFANPFSDLMRAIQHVSTLSEPYFTPEATIYLTNEVHYLIPSITSFYNTNHPQLHPYLPCQLTIKPLPCSITINSTLTTSTHKCITSGSATIVNKMGAQFSLMTSKSISIQNVIIDNIDSVLLINKDPCRLLKHRCCEMVGSMVRTIDGMDANCSMISMPSNCFSTYGRSMFNFHPAHGGRLTLVNVKVMNNFYAYDTIIDATQSNIEVVGSVFDRYQSCGSVITNRPFPTLNTGVMEGVSLIGQESQYLHVQSWRVSISSYLQINSTCTSCHSIIIKSTSFMNLWSEKGYISSNQRGLLGNHGKVIDLDKYKGRVQVESSNFESNQINTKDCSISQIQSKQFNNLAMDYRAGIVVIQTPSSEVELISNKFISNTGYQLGVIYIKSHSSSPIIISNNIFTKNSGVNTPTALQIIQSTHCTSNTIIGNKFTSNIACSPTTAHLISLQCLQPLTVAQESIQVSTSGIMYSTKSMKFVSNSFNTNFYTDIPLVLMSKYGKVVAERNIFTGNVGTLFKEAVDKGSGFRVSMQDVGSVFKSMVVVVQIKSIMVQLDQVVQLVFMDTQIDDYHEMQSQVSAPSSFFHVVIGVNDDVVISGMKFNNLNGLTSSQLAGYTQEQTSETSQYITLANTNFRKGYIGPLVSINILSTTSQVTLSGIHIPSMRVFQSPLPSFTPPKALVYTQEGLGTIGKLTVKDSKISNVMNEGSKQYLIVNDKFVVGSVYTFKNISVDGWGQTLACPFKVVAFFTGWNQVLTQTIFDSVSCKNVKASFGGCILIMPNLGFTQVQKQILTIQNSLFELVTTERGAIYFEEGIYGFQAKIHNCTFKNNLETKAFYAADICVRPTNSINCTHLISSCTFIGSKTQKKGLSHSLQFRSFIASTITIQDSTFNGLESPKYQDHKQQIEYYRTLSTDEMYHSVIFSASVNLHMHNITIYNYHNMQLGALQLKNVVLHKTSRLHFHDISGYQGGAVNLQELIRSAHLNDVLIENVGAYQGAGIYFSKGVLIVENSVFRNNYGMLGGVLYSIESQGIQVINSTIKHNTAYQAGAVLFLLLSRAQVNLFKNCTMTSNLAHAGGIVQTVYSTHQVVDCIFTNNSASHDSLGYVINLSTVSITNTTFELDPHFDLNQTNSYGGFISMQIGAKVYIDGSTFKYGQAQQGGAINGEGEFFLSIINSRFLHCRAQTYGGALYFNGKKEVVISNTTVLNCSTIALGEGVAVYVDQSVVFRVTRLNITAPTQAMYVSSSDFMGSDVHITLTSDIPIPYGGGILASDNSRFYLINSTIQGARNVEKGGGIYLVEVTTVINNYEGAMLNNVTLMHNHAISSGGGIHIQQINMFTMLKCNIINNRVSAQSGYGGGIALFTQQSVRKQVYTMDSSTSIKDNYSAGSGGGIYWSFQGFKSLSKLIYNNSADVYGPDLASYAGSIIMIDATTYQNHKRRSLTSEITPLTPVIHGQQSGAVLPTLYAALVDSRGIIVATDSSSAATLAVLQQPSRYGVTLKGTTTVTANKGIYMFKDVILISDPGEKFRFSFTSTAIKTHLTLEVNIRNCSHGEEFKDNGECVSCQKGIKYLISQVSKPTPCKDCARAKMQCYGGSRVSPAKGYWRSHANSTNFIKCLRADTCLGSTETTFKYSGNCKPSYTGILCSECQKGNSRTSGYLCLKCPHISIDIVRNTLLMLLSIIFIALIVRSTIRNAANIKNLQSVYFKILMNHMQLISLMGQFNFKWSEMIMYLFTILQFGSEISTQFLNFDCLYQSTFGADSNESNQFYFYNLIVYSLIPPLAVMISVIAWSLIYIKVSDPSKLQMKWGKIISTIIILLFLAHPSIVNRMMDSSNCIDINSELRLINKLDTICYTYPHLVWIICLSIPSIVVWGFGIPLFAVYVVNKERATLKSIKTLQKYGFFYNGYKRRYFFWEAVIMYRKIVVIFIAVYLKQAGPLVQALSIYFLIITFMYVNHSVNPFMTKDLNQLEQLSLIANMFTSYFGFYFLSDRPEIYNSSDESLMIADNGVRLNETTQNIFFALIILFNLAFFIYWGKRFSNQLLTKLVRKYPRVYAVVFLCCQFKKVVRRNEESIKHQDHELLRQEFESIIYDVKQMYETKQVVLNQQVFLKMKQYCSFDSILKGTHVDRSLVTERSTFKQKLKDTAKVMDDTKSQLQDALSVGSFNKVLSPTPSSSIRLDPMHPVSDDRMFQRKYQKYQSNENDVFEILNIDENIFEEIEESKNEMTIRSMSRGNEQSEVVSVRDVSDHEELTEEREIQASGNPTIAPGIVNEAVPDCEDFGQVEESMVNYIPTPQDNLTSIQTSFATSQYIFTTNQDENVHQIPNRTHKRKKWRRGGNKIASLDPYKKSIRDFMNSDL